MPSTSTAPPRASAALFTVRARQLLAAGRAAEVVEICTLGLARFPDNVGGYLLLAEAYRALGELDRVRNVLADGVRRTRSARLRKALESGTRSNRSNAVAESDVAEPVPQAKEADAQGSPDTVAGDDRYRDGVEAPVVADTAVDVVDEAGTDAADEIAVQENLPAEASEEKDEEPDAAIEAEDLETVAPDVLRVAEPVHPAEQSLAESERLIEHVLSNLSPLAEPAAESAPERAPDLAPVENLPGVFEEAESVPSDAVEELEPASEPQERSADSVAEPLRAEETAPETLAATDASVAEIKAAIPDSGEPQPEPLAPAGLPTAPPGQESSPRPSQTGGRTSSSLLSLHVRTAPAPKLRSSNLRLIPGLEFAPLRHEEPPRQRQIAALIDEAMPEPNLPELAQAAAESPVASDAPPVGTVPPMPAFTESGEGVAVDAALPVEDVAEGSRAEGDRLTEAIEEVVDRSVPEPPVPPAVLPLVAPAAEAVEAEAPQGNEPLSVEIVAPAAEPDDAEAEIKGGEIELDSSIERDDLELEESEPELDLSRLPSSLPPIDDEGDLPLPGLRARGHRQPATGSRPPALDTRPPAMTPLEELARKLESARIPIVEESSEPPRPVFEPSLVSDTIAEILVRQGAWAEAMKAFQMLARMKPGRHAHYQDRIREMRERITAESGPPLPDHPPTEP